MDKKQNKRQSNVGNIKKHLATAETKLVNGVFVFHGPLTISDFSKKLMLMPLRFLQYFSKKV